MRGRGRRKPSRRCLGPAWMGGVGAELSLGVSKQQEGAGLKLGPGFISAPCLHVRSVLSCVPGSASPTATPRG